MKLATAQAMRRGLEVREADPLGDAAALARLAVWCLGFSPLTSADAPDGLWIDATGCAHLFGGEQALLGAIATRLREAGFADGVFQTLLIGSDAVDSVIASPHVRAVTLTGSEGAGRSVARTAGVHLTKCV